MMWLWEYFKNLFPGCYCPMSDEERLSHLDARGQAAMVDVGVKTATAREAIARGRISMQSATMALLTNHALPKGNALEVARIAGIMAAKRTGDLIPLCHPLGLDFIDVQITIAYEHLDIEATVRCHSKTGVEMEALTAVSVAALALYDMCKAVDKMMMIGEIRLVKKTGGKSGAYLREGEEF